MPLMIRRKPVKKVVKPEEVSLYLNACVALPRLKGFEEYRNLRDKNKAGQEYGFVREWYEKTFEELPPEKPLPLLRLRIEYELVMRDYREAKVDPPASVLHNYKASKAFDIDNLRGIVAHAVRSEILTEGGIENMTKQKNRIAKVEAKKEKKAARVTVTGKYEELFKANNTAKLTDAQLAAEMCKTFPDKKKYNAKDIQGIRAMYNRGGLSTQKGVRPSQECKSWNPEDKKEVPAKAPVAKKVVTAKKKVVLAGKK